MFQSPVDVCNSLWMTSYLQRGSNDVVDTTALRRKTVWYLLTYRHCAIVFVRKVGSGFFFRVNKSCTTSKCASSLNQRCCCSTTSCSSWENTKTSLTLSSIMYTYLTVLYKIISSSFFCHSHKL